MRHVDATSGFIAAAIRLVCTAAATSRLRLFCRCDLLQQPIAATCRSNLSHSPPVLGLKGFTSRFPHLEKFCLNSSSTSFVIGVNLLHRNPSLLFCFFSLYNSLALFYLSKLSFSGFLQFKLKILLYVAKITQNNLIVPLKK